MKKGWIIALSTIFVIVITAVVLSFTLFTVQDVKIDMRTSTSQNFDQEKIIKSSGIKKGKNIIFLNKNKIISNLEKQNPYLKIINIETKFPSSLILHCSERQAVFYTGAGQSYAILDEDLKILEITQTLPSNLIFVNGRASEGEAGSFVTHPFLKEFYDSVLENGRAREDALSMFEKIEYFESNNEISNKPELGLMLTLRSGRIVLLHNFAYGDKFKLAKFYAVESAIYDLAGKLSDEIIRNAEIHINNFLSPDASESESYFYLVYEGQKVTI